MNGIPYDCLKQTRGLCQGDPLSSSLLILATKGLSQLLKDASHKNIISGLKVAKLKHGITHLKFTDDLLIFSKADVKELNMVTRIIRNYELIYIQKVNINKSTCFLPKHLSRDQNTTISTLLKNALYE